MINNVEYQNNFAASFFIGYQAQITKCSVKVESSIQSKQTTRSPPQRTKTRQISSQKTKKQTKRTTNFQPIEKANYSTIHYAT